MKSRRIFFILYPIVTVAVILGLLFALTANTSQGAVFASTDTKKKGFNLLIAGLDEAAENTDVLMLASFQADGRINVLQIPRDTYVRCESFEGKINHIYPLSVRKYGKKEGVRVFVEEISSVLGAPVDRYAVFSGSDLEALVDSLGGVTLSVPYSFSYPDKKGEVRIVPSGEQLLNGEDALAFVRYRSAYAEGDLGRLDAQMRFLASLARRSMTKRDLRTYLRIYQKNYRNLLTNLGEKDIINTIRVYLGKRKEASLRFMRLPGEACLGKDGAWYYALNKTAAAQMLADSFFGVSPSLFDPQKRFLREGELGFVNIYESKGFENRSYTLDEAERIRVLHK